MRKELEDGESLEDLLLCCESKTERGPPGPLWTGRPAWRAAGISGTLPLSPGVRDGYPLHTDHLVLVKCARGYGCAACRENLC